METEINELFAFHKLNIDGQAKAVEIAKQFSALLGSLEVMLGDAAKGRDFAIVKTKMQEACFFAKRAMAVVPENQAR